VQILNPLIREDRVLVYIDDILIPTESVEQNLTTLKEVLDILRKYSFELNLTKCQFLKTTIEFLGYIISENSITLSPRHVEAVRTFKQPENIQEVQRFLGLCSYCRKFIQDYAVKAYPLQNLLKKSIEFEFDKRSVEAFHALQKELTELLLRIYDPSAETELHTDACSLGLAAILLQKQMGTRGKPSRISAGQLIKLRKNITASS